MLAPVEPTPPAITYHKLVCYFCSILCSLSIRLNLKIPLLPSQIHLRPFFISAVWSTQMRNCQEPWFVLTSYRSLLSCMPRAHAGRAEGERSETEKRGEEGGERTLKEITPFCFGMVTKNVETNGHWVQQLADVLSVFPLKKKEKKNKDKKSINKCIYTQHWPTIHIICLLIQHVGLETN